MSQGASPQPLKNAFDILMSRKVQPQQPLKATGRQATKASAAKPKATTQTTPTPRKSSQSHKDSPATALTPSGKPAGVDNVDLTGSPSAQPRCAENALNSVALDRQIVETGHHGRGGGHAHGEEQAGPVSLAGASPASPQRAQQQAQQLLKQMNEAGHESLQQQQPHQQQQGDQGPGTAGGVEAGAAEPPSKRPKLAPPFRKPGARAFSKQVHDVFLVLDLEATCTKRRDLFPVEIIEVSCCLLDAHSLTQRGEWQSFVRPTEHPRLDPFCVELTGITQQQVDTAPLLHEVLSSLAAWLQGQGALREGVSLLPCTWTDWDLKVCLETECEWRRLPRPPYLRRWCNLKAVYTRRYRRTANLRKCVEALGLRWQGRAHSGLDDARNTAALAARMVRDGCVLTVTDQFKEQQQQQQQQRLASQEQQQLGTQEISREGDCGTEGDAGELEGGSQQGGELESGVCGVQGDTDLPNTPVPGKCGAGGGGEGTAGRGQGGGGSGRLRQAVLTRAVALGAGSPPASQEEPGEGHAGAGCGGDGGKGGGTVVMAASVEAGSPPAVQLYDSAGRWLGRCRCGVAAHFRTTKKPGVNLGRQFYSCGRWTITERGRQCDFFAWADAVRLAPGAAGVLAAGGGGGKGAGAAGAGSKRRPAAWVTDG